jgi:Lamin Tail Domain
MKKRILRILLAISVIGVFAYIFSSQRFLKQSDTVRAFGNLTVKYLGVTLGSPIFNVANMTPGNAPETHNIDITNGGNVAAYLAIKGVKKTGDGVLETGLYIKIIEGSAVLYGAGSTTGPKTLKNFFDESTSPNGIQLSIVNAGANTTYKISVDLPSSVGNEIQGRNVTFDLTFGIITSSNIVINEVYYGVDGSHGLDGPKDRTDKKSGQNNEWVELYNPTSSDISLKNWTLTDNSGVRSTINANKTIKAGGFLLISKDASTWKYWNIKPSDTLELGNQVGDGLDNSGDRLTLKNSTGAEVDKVSWGTDTTALNPSIPGVSLGSSIERLVPGLDTNSFNDWASRFPPTLGN